jgi:hypothetical protein
METLKIILFWQSWFESERFLDTLIVPSSIAVAFLIHALLKTQKSECLINILFNEKDPIVGLKELSGLKIFAILNIVLGFGLVVIGSVIVYKFKGISLETIYFILLTGILLPSLGWSYAFYYLEEAWDRKTAAIQKISSFFLIIATIQFLVFIYKGNIKQCSLFYLTIPSLVLLLKSKTEKEIRKKQRTFWISSLVFNIVLIFLFSIQGLQAIDINIEETGLGTRIILILMPILAMYISLLNYQKYLQTNPLNNKKTGKIIKISAFAIVIGLIIIISFGIKKTLINIKELKVEYNS